MTYATTKRTLFHACTTWPSNTPHTIIHTNKQLLRQQLFDQILDYIGLEACQVHLMEQEDVQMYALTIRLVWLRSSKPLPLIEREVGE
ncbi:MAG: hypothetical protein AAGF95_28600 [Chloroflexota bacterium]